MKEGKGRGLLLRGGMGRRGKEERKGRRERWKEWEKPVLPIKKIVPASQDVLEMDVGSPRKYYIDRKQRQGVNLGKPLCFVNCESLQHSHTSDECSLFDSCTGRKVGTRLVTGLLTADLYGTERRLA